MGSIYNFTQVGLTSTKKTNKGVNTISIYKLTPTEKESEHWRATTYKGPVIIRATNEDSRKIAELEFFKVTKRTSVHGDTLLSPWLQPDLVKCERLENSDYAENGPAEVLFPKEKTNLRRS
jgi:hypothetical protein